MDARTALAHWLATLDRERLTALLEERDLPPAPRPALADHLLADASVGRALLARTAGELELLASVAALALDRYGPADEAPRYPWRQPAQRLVPERDVLAWFEPGEERRRAQRTLTLLRERALLLPAPAGRLALPPLLHARAAARAGYGRPVARLLTAAYGAAELKRIAYALFGPGAQPRTGDQARHLVTGFLTDPARVRDLAAKAPARARKLLAALVPGPPQLRTRCFVSRYGSQYAGPDTRYVFRASGSGDRGVDWPAARGLLVPVGPDLVELPYEVARALRGECRVPKPRLVPDPLTETVPVAPGREGEGGAAAAAAVRRAGLVLRALAAEPAGIRKAGGIAVRDTRRLARAAGADEAETRLWLDLAVRAGLAAPRRERLLPGGRYDAWAAAPPADKLALLLTTWAGSPVILSHRPDRDEYAVDLRNGVLQALATLPGGLRLTGSAQGYAELLSLAAWFRPPLGALGNGAEDLPDRLAATLAEAALLGVVAHGALTPVGRALCGLPAAGAGPAALREAVGAALPAPTTTARFQSDLTATVTGPPDPALAELLSTVGDVESEGHAVVWRITAASVRRALDAGWNPDDLLARLTTAGAGALPQPLAYTIKDAARPRPP
ncbi:helicase-associated domain-containing protein [Streptomyces sp. NPDC046161]|uniref:helicase-associated domain-containing protein n=1 Tax=Streptomyces sp. NPDC046161 TaxID=3155132 RepID=UPI0033C9605F